MESEPRTIAEQQRRHIEAAVNVLLRKTDNRITIDIKKLAILLREKVRTISIQQAMEENLPKFFYHIKKLIREA